MKRTLLIITAIVSGFASEAQKVISPVTGVNTLTAFDYTGIETSSTNGTAYVQFTTVAAGDSVWYDYTTNSAATYDTIMDVTSVYFRTMLFKGATIDVDWYVIGLTGANAGTVLAGPFTTQYVGETATADNQAGTVVFGTPETVDFSISATDQVRLVFKITGVTQNEFTTARFRIYNNLMTVGTITDATADVFANGNASVANPVSNGLVEINDLPNDFASVVQLVSLDGNIITSKTITAAENTFDVSDLESGLYLLRDVATGSARKIMIK